MRHRYIKVTPTFGNWVRRKRRELELSQQALINRVAPYPSARTIKKIEAGRNLSFRDDTLMGLANGLELSFESLLCETEKLWDMHKKEVGSLFNFQTLYQLSKNIDQYILQLIRSHYETLGQNLLHHSYHDLLFSQLHGYGVNLNTFLNIKNNTGTIKKVLSTLPKEDLIINVEDDLNFIEYVFDDKQLTISKPELLWDCSCDITANNEFCNIHSWKYSEELSYRMHNCQVKINWRGSSFYWNEASGLWPPSIDSFMLILALEKSDLLSNKNINCILDIGTGTGFLGIILANMKEEINRLFLSDWTISSYLYSLINCLKNITSFSNIEHQFLLGLNTEWVNFDGIPENIDLIICNPPYLPVPNQFKQLRTRHTVAGTDLLEHVISNAHKVCRRVIIQFSNLVSAEAEKAAHKAGVCLIPLNEGFDVPFRVEHAYNQNGYIDWLINRRGLSVLRNRRHKLYHRIQTFMIQPKQETA